MACVTCIECGVEFPVKPYQAETRKFCSMECKLKHSKIPKTCECCGKEFWVYKSALESQSRRFCSQECRVKVMAAKPKPTRKLKEQVFKICKACGIEFRVPLIRKDTATYCSRKCQSDDPDFKLKSSLAQRGEKSSKYAGGISEKSDGYMAEKSWGNLHPVYTTQHRVILAKRISEFSPGHPFLVEIDGLIRIRPEIHVHHIDRDKLNNEVDNLLAVTASAHIRLHKSGRKPDPWECWPSNPERW